MKYSLIAASLVFLASQTAFAFPPKPERCPDASVIQSVGVERVLQGHLADPSPQTQNQWVGIQVKNDYQTKQDWTFVIGDFKADNDTDALALAQKAMQSSLQFVAGPIKEARIGRWFCQYKNALGNKAFAVTPEVNIPQTLIK